MCHMNHPCVRVCVCVFQYVCVCVYKCVCDMTCIGTRAAGVGKSVLQCGAEWCSMLQMCFRMSAT